MLKQLFLLITSVIFFWGASDSYSLPFCTIVTLFYLYQVIPFVLKIGKENYLNFYTIFFISFFFTNFFYPTVLYPIDPEFFSVFTLDFNHNYINKGTALANIAASSFIFGVKLLPSLANIRKSYIKKYYYSHKNLTYITVLTVLLFVGLVGRSFLSGNFTGQSSVSLYILQVITCMFILTSIIFIKYYEFQRRKFTFYLLTLCYILLFLAIGDRGPTLSLLLILIGLYSFYVKKITIRTTLIVGISGIFLMHIIGEGRTTDSSEANQNIITRGLTSVTSTEQSYYDFTKGFVVNTRNLYVGIEYVENNGLNYGRTYLSSIIGIIPFGQAFTEELTSLKMESSSDFFTTLQFGSFKPYGLGTNLVADVYIAFGLIGVIGLFGLFGKTVEYYRRKSLIDGRMVYNIIYFTLLSYSIYYARTGIFMPLKYIIWTLLIYHFLKSIKLLKPIQIP